MDFEIIEGIIEWILIISPIIISLLSLAKYLKKRSANILVGAILGCCNFLLSIYIPMCNFSYFYRANFISNNKKGDLSYLINELSYNSNDAKIILTINIVLYLITVINLFYCLRKEK